jgi:hypothetical protein
MNFLFLIICPRLFGQAMDEDLIQFTDNYRFEEGVYLSFNEFKINKPSVKTFKVKGNSIQLFNDSIKEYLPMNPDSVWAYSDSKNVYVSKEGQFWKIINLGKLCHFTAITLTKFQTVDTFGFPIERYSRTINHYFFDIGLGEVVLLNEENLDVYLKDNLVLNKKFKKKIKKEIGLIVALKSYNELNPIYFPLP